MPHDALRPLLLNNINAYISKSRGEVYEKKTANNVEIEVYEKICIDEKILYCVGTKREQKHLSSLKYAFVCVFEC